MNFRGILSRMVSNPRVFELQTKLLGGARLAEALQPIATKATKGQIEGTVVDVGGGTSSGRALWPEGWEYISIDPDPRVVDFKSDPSIKRVVGDASNLGFPDQSVDVVLMKNVSHHLDDQSWESALREVNRVLKPTGSFVFVDALWSRRRAVSRVAWSLDAGRYPRPSERIERDLAARFEIDDLQRMTLVHHCVLVTARPRHSAGAM